MKSHCRLTNPPPPSLLTPALSKMSHMEDRTPDLFFSAPWLGSPFFPRACCTQNDPPPLPSPRRLETNFYVLRFLALFLITWRCSWHFVISSHGILQCRKLFSRTYRCTPYKGKPPPLSGYRTNDPDIQHLCLRIYSIFDESFYSWHYKVQSPTNCSIREYRYLCMKIRTITWPELDLNWYL